MNKAIYEPGEAFAALAALVGERSRAVILWNLLDGRAYTATELAMAADLSFQAASNHLSRLQTGGLIRSVKQGRHKYYRLLDDQVAHMVESLASLVPFDESSNSSHANTGIKFARTCYDHLAGKVGVQLAESIVRLKWLRLDSEKYELTKTGAIQLKGLGVDLDRAMTQHRKFAYPCVDWSERKPHLAGALGAALLKAMISQDWIRKTKHSREVILTGIGKIQINKWFNTSL